MPAGPTAKMGVLPAPACATGVDRLYAKEVVLLPLEVREGTFRFAGARFLKATGQGLIEGATRFGLLAGLELRHSQIKKRIGLERPFPSAFLK